MNILYIGHYNEGSTSRMRGEYIREILNPAKFNVANIDIPLYQENRIFRSIGWRYKVGPLINNINKFINSIIQGNYDYDLVWVDKGVFINPSLIKKLRLHSKKLVHFTPDPAFTYHQSNLFFQALPYYDYVITTKSFEMNLYKKFGAKNIIFCTQGYDNKIHKPYYSYEEKEGIVFIGHYEKDRANMLQSILKKDIPITLAGIGWHSFYLKHQTNNNLKYLGNGIFGEEYARTISKGIIALGFLSKIIPELHTTRTIEIPACNTVLVTERNTETQNIFNEDEVIFFNGINDFAEKIVDFYPQKKLLESISQNGYRKITASNFDYRSIVESLIQQIIN